MPKHPDTGEDISNPVYDAIMAERARAEQAIAQAKVIAAASAPPQSETRPQSPPDFVSRDMYDDRYRDDRGGGGPGLMGCMVVIMFVLMVVMGGFIVWQQLRTTSTPQPPTPAVVPSGNLAALTAPVTTKLAYDPAKAVIVRDTYAGFAEAVAGRSGERITSTQVLESVQRALLTDVDAGSGPAIGADIDNAIGGQLGIAKSTDPSDPGWEPKQLDATDRAKLVEVLRAISKAAEASL